MSDLGYLKNMASQTKNPSKSAFVTLDGRVSSIDPSGYGQIMTATGKVVLFVLSQVKTPAGANVGSTQLGSQLIGEPVQVRAKPTDGNLFKANTVTLNSSKWDVFADAKG